MANFEDAIMRDTRANQPAAGIAGRLYYVTDENVTERDSGSAWEDCSDVAALVTEDVQDIVGAMLSGNTETGISVTYQDSDGTIDFVVDVVDDTAYDATTWNGDTTHAPSKNAVRDKIESLSGASVVYPKTATMWHDQSLVTTGNALRKTLNTSQRYTLYTDQNAAANGDVSENGFFIAAGTYTFRILGVSSTDAGKLDVSVDAGSVLGTIDFYSASPVFNYEANIASFVISADGYHKLKMTINGKHASSSSYHAYITKMWLEPSAY